MHTQKALSVPDVMDRLGVKQSTVWKLLREGHLPRRKIGGRPVVLQSDVDAYLDALPVVNAA